LAHYEKGTNTQYPWPDYRKAVTDADAIEESLESDPPDDFGTPGSDTRWKDAVDIPEDEVVVE